MPQWKQFSGNWTVTQQVQAKGAGTWPAVPGAPTIGTATAGVGEVSVAFTAPSDTGYPTTLTYEVTSSPESITATGSASPIVVTGLTNGTEYTFTVTATNDTGTGPASAASNAATPQYLYPVGALYSSGNNEYGELGLGDAGPLLPRSSPTQVGALATWTKPSMMLNTAACLKSDGTLWAWGNSQEGSMPGGVNASSPVQVGALTTWSDLSSGRLHTLALKSDGTLWAWGWNDYGQLGQNNQTNRNSPVQIGSDNDWSVIATNFGSSFAIKTDGTLWAWGQNNRGQLAQSNTVYYSSPVQVGTRTWWAALSGQKDSIIAKSTSNRIYAWGYNDYGELGQSNKIARSSPVQIGALTTWDKLSLTSSLGFAFSMIKNDGTLWGLGGPAAATGADLQTSSPVQIGSDTDWSKAFNLYEAGYAIKTDGSLYLWGQSNSTGRLGNNTTSASATPVQFGVDTDWSFVTGANTTGLFIKS